MRYHNRSLYSFCLLALLVARSSHGFVPTLNCKSCTGCTCRVGGPLSAGPLKLNVRSPLVSEEQQQQQQDEEAPPQLTPAPRPLPQMSSRSTQDADEMESWEAESKIVELVALGTWLAAISGFILVNNFVGPWPSSILRETPERVWFVFHMVGGMLFGGGVILTTCFEWLVSKSQNKQVLSFYFDKVPLLDAMIVLPALTAAMISGTGLAVQHYGSLGTAPLHIQYVFWCLTGFATWWAVTDLATQGRALADINEWVSSTHHLHGNTVDHLALPQDEQSETEEDGVPSIVHFRKLSNIVSCGFVFALYYIMVMKPGTLF